jgi:hypothetical protein
MESLAITVVFILLGYLFIAGFFGFVTGDNCEGYAPATIGALLPGLAIGWYFSSDIAIAFWAFGFFLGYGIGFFFRTMRDYES